MTTITSNNRQAARVARWWADRYADRLPANIDVSIQCCTDRYALDRACAEISGDQYGWGDQLAYCHVRQHRPDSPAHVRIALLWRPGPDKYVSLMHELIHVPDILSGATVDEHQTELRALADCWAMCEQTRLVGVSDAMAIYRTYRTVRA